MSQLREGPRPSARTLQAAFLLLGLLALGRATVLGPPIVHLTKRLYLGWAGGLGVAAFAALRWRRPVVARAAALWLSLGLAEGTAAGAYRVLHGGWHHRTLYRRPVLFDRHPYLVGVPHPGLDYREGRLHASHTPGRWRGPGLGRPGATIAAIGGSSTYCVQLSDEETWPYQLEQALGPSHPVVNLGVPGYGTVEHVIQTAFLLPEIEPRLAIYYVGWNDARNSGIRNLRADYAEFHGWSQARTLEVTSEVVFGAKYLALPTLLLEALDAAGALDVSPPRDVRARGQLLPEGRTDPRALEIFRRNLRSIVALARARGVVPVLAPQIVNRTRLTSEGRYGWLPFVRDRDVPALVDAYNAVLAEVAAERDVAYLAELLETGWTPEDFLDEGHFSPSGARRFASIVAAALRTRGLVTD